MTTSTITLTPAAAPASAPTAPAHRRAGAPISATPTAPAADAPASAAHGTHPSARIQHGAALPCRSTAVADLYFSERPADLERAKELCSACPLRSACRDGALERAEPWGVWGGEIFEAGRIIAVKRGRGRPRKNAA